MASKKNSQSHSSWKGKMSNYITRFTFKPKTVQNLTLVDYRLLSDVDKSEYHTHMEAGLLSTPSKIYCGGPGIERIALKQELALNNGEMSEEAVRTFLSDYRALANTRVSAAEFVGKGVVRFGVRNAAGTIIGAVTTAQNSILNVVGDQVRVKTTPVLFRKTIRTFNAALTRITAGWIEDQALLLRFLLNAVLDVNEAALQVRVDIVNSHYNNLFFATNQAIIDYDAALKAIVDTFTDVVAIPAVESNGRAYFQYGRTV